MNQILRKRLSAWQTEMRVERDAVRHRTFRARTIVDCKCNFEGNPPQDNCTKPFPRWLTGLFPTQRPLSGSENNGKKDFALDCDDSP
ncbi:hypothetical protein Q31a_56990 [Aureliella helgolandensis]|uniref:Uncharacterized protein n=1 Tax=Aureliella helgolandensis TaxID=2527968 RepID=A0A518GFD0_9BACT|nr:hypothetical protein Q31a_56990 [Aureliella helgolandensis]